MNRSRILIVFIFCYLFQSDTKAQYPSFEWVNTDNSGSENFLYSIKANNEVSYTAGHFINGSNYDGIIYKFEANGNIIWSRTIDGPGGLQIRKIDIDSSENIYMTGNFNGTCDFDPDPFNTYSLSSTGSDIFLLKFDSTGNFIWANKIGGQNNDIGYGLHCDESSVYLLGNFFDSIDVDPGLGNQILFSAGENDNFISKFDLNGNLTWSKQISGSGEDYAISVDSDPNNNIYVTGTFNLTADFDPGAGLSLLNSNGARDIFILKLNSGGDFLFAQQIGGVGNDEGHDISIDISNNVFISGVFVDSADFNPGPGILYLNNSFGGLSGFILKIDTSGNFNWAKCIQGNGSSYLYSSRSTANGDIYCYGKHWGTNDFDFGTGIQNLTSSGAYDIYVLKLNQNGDFLWARSLGSPYWDFAMDMQINSNEEIFFCGTFTDTVDFDPEFSIQNRVGTNQYNQFYCKWGNTGNGLSELVYEDNYLIYPNPSSGNFTIAGIDVFPGGNTKIAITDFYGKIVVAEFNPGSLNTFSLNLSSGIYFVRITDNSQTTIKKIIIN